jgi:putative tryptophan/tyrosine transport system substrate-binding protein
MAIKTVVVLLLSLTLGSVRFAEAQQSKKVPRIGYLSATSPSANVARIEAFRQGLRELGYVEGKNIVIEWRFAELVSLKVEVIVTTGGTVTRAAKEATVTIPVVSSWRSFPPKRTVYQKLLNPTVQ